MNGSTIHHHENHSDKPNAGIKVNKNASFSLKSSSLVNCYKISYTLFLLCNNINGKNVQMFII